MTFRTLSDECWRDLPPVRKWLAGRAAADKLLADAVREFEPDRVGCDGYEERLLGRVRRRNEIIDGNEGFAVLAFLAITIAAAVISWLVQRWLDNHFPKEELETWLQELQS